jgi:FMN phosphatase YigB (HAD superfamily)
MNVILDLWGVLVDEKKMNKEYNKHAASILASRFGGDPARWLDAYDMAWADYQRRFRATDWDNKSWSDVVGELDVRLITDTLDAVGVQWRPSDILSFARNLEFEVVSSVARCYLDVPGALRRLKEKGHEVHVATQAGEWNAIGALEGSGLLKEVKAIFSGSSQNASKDRKRYWMRVLEKIDSPPDNCILVDDRPDFLEAAASIGIGTILMDREKRTARHRLPQFVDSRMFTLTSLPHHVERISHK